MFSSASDRWTTTKNNVNIIWVRCVPLQGELWKEQMAFRAVASQQQFRKWHFLFLCSTTSLLKMLEIAEFVLLERPAILGSSSTMSVILFCCCWRCFHILKVTVKSIFDMLVKLSKQPCGHVQCTPCTVSSVCVTMYCFYVKLPNNKNAMKEDVSALLRFVCIFRDESSLRRTSKWCAQVKHIYR